MTDERAEKSESEQLAFFTRSHERFLRARDTAGAVSRFYRVAGTTVQVTFAGDALVPYATPALEHLRVPAAEPDLTLCVWDSRSTSVDMVPPPCARRDFTDQGEVLGFHSSRIKFAFQWSDCSLSLLDHLTRTGIYWVPDAAAVPYWARAIPVRTLLHWWLQRHGCQILHAAAVGTDDGAVLIAGKSGRGKSTAALSCLQSGLIYLGDDSVAVRLEPEPVVYSLYCAAKLQAEDIAQFPSVADLVCNPREAGREKHVMFLYPRFERQVARELPLRAILLPQVAGPGETSIAAAQGGAVLRAFTPMSELRLPHLNRRTHEFFCRLCSAVPGYTLNLGRNRKTTATAIADLLSRPHAAPAAHDAQPSVHAMPLISVIVAVFNGERHIRDAVEGALSQDYPALEILVIDDGSTDWTPQIVWRLPYEVRYFRTARAGPAAARNRGIREASGEFLAFLDLPDLWPEHTLRRLVDELVRDAKIDVVYGAAQFVRKNPETDEYEPVAHPRGPADFCAPAAVFRKSAFVKAGLFDGTSVSCRDADWLACARACEVRIRRATGVTLLVRLDRLDVTAGGNAAGFSALRLLKETADRNRGHAAPAPGRTITGDLP